MTVVEYGSEVNIVGNYIDPNTKNMVDGRYYEATYALGDTVTQDEAWMTNFPARLQYEIENQPGCYFRYAYIEPGGILRVQWLYDYSQYASVMAASGTPVPAAVPLVIVAIVIGLAIIAIIAYFVSQTILTIKEGVATLGPEYSIIMILVGLAAVGVVAYFLLGALRNSGRQKEYYDMLS